LNTANASCVSVLCAPSSLTNTAIAHQHHFKLVPVQVTEGFRNAMAKLMFAAGVFLLVSLLYVAAFLTCAGSELQL